MDDPADLSRLADIVVPPPVPWWPPAPGWWIVGAALLGVVVVLASTLIARRHRNAYRRRALAELDAIGAPADTAALTAISAVLKRTALVAYPRAEVASLTGDAWLRFLARTGRGGESSGRLGAILSQAAVSRREVEDGTAILAAARRWVRRHRGEG